MSKKSIRFVDIKKKLNKEKTDKLNKGKTRKNICQAPQGMHDIVFDEKKIFDKVVQEIYNIACFYGYEQIITPILEYGDLFVYGLGKDNKDLNGMFWIKNCKNKKLALRLEGTIPIVRAFLEHNMSLFLQPTKIFYIGPFFNNTELYKAGFEIIEDDNIINDVELIWLSKIILQDLNLDNVRIELNSIGCPKCFKNYEKAIKKYYRSKKNRLCASCRKYLDSNILMLLNCQEENCRALRVEAPKIKDFLCTDCKNNLQNITQYLKDMHIPFVLNPELVLRDNYYNKTIWSFVYDNIISEDNKETIVLAYGGRQDNLLKLFTGQNKLITGLVLNIYDIVNVLKTHKLLDVRNKIPNFFLMPVGETAKKKSFEILEELRKNDIKILFSFGKDSVRSQMKFADKIKTKYILLLGQEEVNRNEIILQEASSELQENIPLPKLIKVLKNKLNNA